MERMLERIESKQDEFLDELHIHDTRLTVLEVKAEGLEEVAGQVRASRRWQASLIVSLLSATLSGGAVFAITHR
jgi:hypothetical protein